MSNLTRSVLVASAVIGLGAFGSPSAQAQSMGNFLDGLNRQMGAIIDCAGGDCAEADRINRAWQMMAPSYQAETFRQGVGNSINQQNLRMQYNNTASQYRHLGSQLEEAAEEAEEADDENAAAYFRSQAEAAYEQADYYSK